MKNSYVIEEKKDITVVFKTKTNAENSETLLDIKRTLTDLSSEFNISLFMNQEIDETVPENEIRIEYYSKASASEKIGSNYLNFLDKFLDLGTRKNIKTYPMD
ncbi:hypothetical protein [Aliarcobacter butzleri]|uniref:hypothetical protein n=1 Tax=Aliarcobacter butzleri TaxID=28197 RepID=UPI0021B2664B|nr:hypothetical protein [Aliarcobacter butzleri]MCT7600284.1 hypothetical protein [Aliarcobacter butzleri]MCT7632985.1 hypothetical protein [Aliarcobacter butzleri]